MASLAYWDDEIAYARLAGGTASRLNEGTLRYAYRFAFSSQSSDELLAQAIRLRGSGPKVHVQRSNSAAR